jgi:hypothetical protein
VLIGVAIWTLGDSLRGAVPSLRGDVALGH